VASAVGRTLMEVLRELDYGVAAACGGLCSCATCHVYIDQTWVERLPPCGPDERDALTDLAHYREQYSRLSCQLWVTRELDGLRLAIAPDE
jgi:2Fe-2S ferredoxin